MISTSAAASLMVPEAPADAPLPPAGNVLAVTARPGQESADLGGLLYAFRRTGASLALLCLTRGEASPLNSTSARLEAIRPWELQLAASILGISRVTVASYPDGALCRYPAAELTDRVRRAIHQHSADLLLVIDPAADDPDDTAVATAACAAARLAGVPTMARTAPPARGSWMIDLDTEAAVARAIQKSAAAAHASQSDALPQLTRRLDLLDGTEQLRWLVSPAPEPGVSDFPAGQHAHRCRHIQRDAQGPGEVLGGAERQDAQGYVAVGQVPCRQAQGTVTAAGNQQAGPQVQRGREAGLQLAGPADRK
jgi:N-acetylglucosamine malate deacetylase 2